MWPLNEMTIIYLVPAYASNILSECIDRVRPDYINSVTCHLGHPYIIPISPKL